MKHHHRSRPTPIVFDVRGGATPAEPEWLPPEAGWPQDRLYEASMLRAQARRYWAALRKRWWVLLLALVLVGGPAVMYAYLKAPQYACEAVMFMGQRLSLPETRVYAEELSSYLGTQGELLKSSTVAARAFQKVCARLPELFPVGTNGVPEGSPFGLSVSSSPRNSALHLSATGPEPQATQAYLDEVIAEYLAFKRDSRQQTSVNALSSITDQIEQVKGEMNQLEARLVDFKQSNNVAYLTESGQSAGSHLARLVEVLSNLRTEHRLLELLTPEQLTSLPGSAVTSVPGVTVPGEETARAISTSTAGYQAGYYQALQQLQLLKARRAQFARNLRPTHSKMVRFNQEIDGLEQLLNTLKGEGEQQAMAQIANRKRSLELQIRNLENQYSALETNAVTASWKLAEHDRMVQELQRSQGLHDRLLGLVQSVDLNKSLDQEPLKVLAPASPGRPTRTRMVIAVAGVFMACMAGVGLLLLLEFFSDRFTSPAELSLHLDEEVVGQIPDSPRGNAKQTPGVLAASLGGEEAFAESFRGLRSSLLFMPAEAVKPRIMLVTSAVPKEGKTTVSANFAATLAQAGSRVLLVDADLRRSSLHRIFGVQHQPGLWEVLFESVAASKAIVGTSQPNLFLLPAGESRSSGSEVFLRPVMDRLLTEWAGQYDYVLIDSAPVLATDDAGTLGPKADGVFVVVRASHTSSQMVREALHRLRRRNVKVLGVIYNRATPSTDYYCRYTRDYYGARKSTAKPRELTAAAANAKPAAVQAPAQTGPDRGKT